MLTTLIKVYEENEKIYTNLASQNALLIEANSKWCQQEKKIISCKEEKL